MTAAPARTPCYSCPYRRDVPSGVWSSEEYEKLPRYDAPTHDQPVGAFFCHQQDGRLCAGWVGCHDMEESLGLRLAVAFGHVSEVDAEAALNYESPVPLFESGAAASEHGLRDIEAPGPEAQRIATRLSEKLMATVFDDQGRELPHPDVPCAWCDELVMDELACPNAKDICIDCCGETH